VPTGVGAAEMPVLAGDENTRRPSCQIVSDSGMDWLAIA
jgi:hypothetical protein